jgi:putative redox protein
VEETYTKHFSEPFETKKFKSSHANVPIVAIWRKRLCAQPRQTGAFGGTGRPYQRIKPQNGGLMHSLTGRDGDTNMDCTINWMNQSGMAFMAETGSGHIINMDGAPEGGGRNLAPRPMEMVLAGTGGCTAYDVVLILKRGRHDVRGCQVKLTADRADTDPKVFTKINMHFLVTGAGLTETAVARAIQMSHEKYCSASIMIGKTAEITTSFEIVAA